MLIESIESSTTITVNRDKKKKRKRKKKNEKIKRCQRAANAKGPSSFVGDRR